MNKKDLDEWQDEMLKKHGWFVHNVPDEKYAAGLNYHTHGVEGNFGHLDFQCTLPIDTQILSPIISNLVERVKKGEKFSAGKIYRDVIRDYPVEFIEAEEMHRKVLRLVLPDSKGFFPNDPLCETVYKKQYNNLKKLRTV